MSGKFKALGLGVLVAIAVSAVAAINASATYSGHFVVEAAPATIAGTENATHKTRFTIGTGAAIECTKVSYSGTIGATTVAGFTVKPKYEECKTEGTEKHDVTITMNGCEYTFKSTAGVHATFWFYCPTGGVMEIHHPNCTVTIPDQSMKSGVSYKNVLEDGKHALTATLTVENITMHYHGGVCLFLGTSQTGTLKGSITLKASKDGKPIHVTNT